MPSTDSPQKLTTSCARGAFGSTAFWRGKARLRVASFRVLGSGMQRVTNLGLSWQGQLRLPLPDQFAPEHAAGISKLLGPALRKAAKKSAHFSSSGEAGPVLHRTFC
eukprot:s112_g37.t1